MSKLQSNKELVAVGHQLGKVLSSDTPIIDIAKILSRLAERLDCITAAPRKPSAISWLRRTNYEAGACSAGRDDKDNLPDEIRDSPAFTALGWMAGWNACRAAMLQGAEPVSQRDELPHDPQIAAYEKIMEQAIPDGYALVPVEPTMAMLDEFDSIIDHGAEDSKDAWSRLLAATPQQEEKRCNRSCTTQQNGLSNWSACCWWMWLKSLAW